MMIWPPQSLDLNPIEVLWDELDRKAGVRCPQSQKQLQEELLDTWHNIPPNPHYQVDILVKRNRTSKYIFFSKFYFKQRYTLYDYYVFISIYSSLHIEIWLFLSYIIVIPQLPPVVQFWSDIQHMSRVADLFGFCYVLIRDCRIPFLK